MQAGKDEKSKKQFFGGPGRLFLSEPSPWRLLRLGERMICKMAEHGV
jgi:hypothetical protein